MTQDIEQLREIVYDLVKKRKPAWESGLRGVEDAITSAIHAALSIDDDSDRLKLAESRIKDPDRIVEKVERKDYLRDSAGAHPGDEIERKVQDIVGVKVVGKSPRDIEKFMESLASTCTKEGAKVTFAQEPDDYMKRPKDSGYRACHVILNVPVSQNNVEHMVQVELQAKTMLQNAWSELTHEDSYKPGSFLKPNHFQAKIARAMSELLAAVDGMADSLAEELAKSTVPAPVSGAAEALEAAKDPAHPKGSAEEGALASGDAKGTGSTEEPITKASVVTVVRVEERFALAINERNRQGLVSARDVRDLLVESGKAERFEMINVSDHLEVGKQLHVVEEENDDALFFHPMGLEGVDAH